MANTLKQEEATPTAPAFFLPVQDKDTYLKAAAASSVVDPTRGWTVSSPSPLQQDAQVPGQRFTPSELPDPEVARAVGFQPQAIPEQFILGADDEVDPQGPEPSTVLKAEYREALRERIIKAAEENEKSAAEAVKENTSQKPSPAAASTPGDSPASARK